MAGSPAQAALVDALIAARLLVSDEDAEGHAVVRVAHEALLSRWPRARDIVNANRSFLETRARVQADAHRWLSDNRNPDLLLPPGKRLAEGEELLQSRREEVDDQTIAYIEASSAAQQAAAEKERQAERSRIEADEAAKRERLEREADAELGGSSASRAIGARSCPSQPGGGSGDTARAANPHGCGYRAGLGNRGWRRGIRRISRSAGGRSARPSGPIVETSQKPPKSQAQAAETQAKAAEKQARAAEEKALEARDEALRNQSLSLALLCRSRPRLTGDTEAAILLALEALPQGSLWTRAARICLKPKPLSTRLLADHERDQGLRHDGGVTDAAFSRTGTVLSRRPTTRPRASGTSRMARRSRS